MRKVIISIMLLATLAATLLTACTANGPGGIITEEKEFTNFTHIDASSLFEVEVSQSDIFSITISTDSNLHDYVVVSSAGNTLSIYLDPQHTFTDFSTQPRTLKAKITMPELHGLSLSGGSKATINRFTLTGDLNVTLSGLSYLKMKDVEMRDLDCEVSGGSEVSGSIYAGNTSFNISGISTIDLSGSAENVWLQAKGGSGINLADFPANNVSVSLEGMSEATVNAKVSLMVTLVDSKLYFIGNPTIEDIDTSGLSVIKQR